MTSEAAVMSKPVSRGMPFTFPPSPVTIWRSERSFMSRQRRHVTVSGSMPSALPWRMCASSIAARRLFAAVIAWRSPVKWRLRSSIGTTCAWPPPAAPPFTPKTGPSDASRRQRNAFWSIAAKPCASETAVVVFPSPAGVGVIAVTAMSLPSGVSARRSRTAWETFAL